MFLAAFDLSEKYNLQIRAFMVDFLCVEKIMRMAILFTALLLLNTDLFSKGGVNVEYIPIDSVDTRYVGQQVKIDFNSGTKKKHLIQKARTPDTVKIVLNDREIDLIEVKGTGVDYWYFSKEYLKSYNFERRRVLKIEHIVVEEVAADSILFRMTLGLFRNERAREPVSSEVKDIWLTRNKMEGLLIKK
jgi:hypothetical protein